MQGTFSHPPKNHQCPDLEAEGRREFLMVFCGPVDLRYLSDAVTSTVTDIDVSFLITCDSPWHVHVCFMSSPISVTPNAILSCNYIQFSIPQSPDCVTSPIGE